MFMEDREMDKLLLLPGIQQLKDDYAEKLTALADEIKNDGLAIRQKQEEEMNELECAMRNVQHQRQKAAILVIDEYEHKVDMLVAAMNATLSDDGDGDGGGGGGGGGGGDGDGEMNEKKIKKEYIEKMNIENGDMRNSTFEQEIILVEKTENIVNEFESRYGDLRAASADLMENYFRDAEVSVFS